MHVRKYILVVSFSFLNLANSLSQSSFTAVWLDYNQSKKLSEKWTLQDDFGYRFRFVNEVNWQRFHARGSMEYQMKKVKLGIGLFTDIIYNQTGTQSFEIRPFQFARYTWPRGKRVKLNHFVRLEERQYFLQKFNAQREDFFELKFRYGLLFFYHVNPKHKDVGKINVLAGIEPFINIFEPNEPFEITNNRTTVGAEILVLPNLNLRLTYIYETYSIPIIQNTDDYANKFRISFIQKF